jgi:hypothetical protein
MQITLHDCTRSGSTMSFPGRGSTIYTAGWAIFGTHANYPLTSNSITVRIPNLDGWLPIGGLATEFEAEQDGRRIKRLTGTYQPPPTVNFAIPGGHLDIVPAASFSASPTSLDRQVRFTEWFDVRLRLDEPMPVSEVLVTHLGPLADLTTLLTSRPAHLSRLGVMAAVESLDGTPLDVEMPLDILFHQFGASVNSRPLRESDFLLDPTDEETPTLEDLVTRWYDCRTKFKRSMDIAFGAERHPGQTYTEVKFLTICHAAEAFHRDHGLSQNRWTKSEYRDRREAALSAVQGTDMEPFVKDQLRHANDITLLERLRSLAAHALGQDQSLVSDDVLKRIKTARNNYTHSSTKELAKLDSAPDLHYLTQYTLWILRAGFLRELGLEPEQVTGVLLKNAHFSWLRNSFSA